MRWWNDLWLNEGFATYMQYLSLQRVFPELQAVSIRSRKRLFVFFLIDILFTKQTFYVNSQEILFLSVRFRVMDKDALISSHPVSTAVVTPDQVEEMFDSVSYEKVLPFFINVL